MDIMQLYHDYGVDFVTEGHKHSRPGWVNTSCPWCTGNPGYHLGYEEEGNYYYCWRCGWHAVVPTIAKLVNLSEPKVRSMIHTYGIVVPKVEKKIVPHSKKDFRFPSGTSTMGTIHDLYLMLRKFDPDEIKQTWNLMGTGPVAVMDRIDFKFRIIIPIAWDGRDVSFTSRDITGKSELRYITCPKDREIINHKYILYGQQEHWGHTGICVEGPTDTWRMGVCSFAVFGIKYTAVQLRTIAKNFKRVAVCFDDDPQAIFQANNLVAELRFRGVDAFRVDITGDPGSMKQEEANYLVKQLL